jgi:hypothetical protein
MADLFRDLAITDLRPAMQLIGRLDEVLKRPPKLSTRFFAMSLRRGMNYTLSSTRDDIRDGQ